MTAFFTQQLDYVFFLYGLAFFLLGAACLTLRPESLPALPWRWLAGFALLHGTAEWMDLALLVTGKDPGLMTAKTLVMTVSFLCLVELGRIGLATAGGMRLCRLCVYGPLGAVLLALAANGGVLWLDIGARYLVGLPGALLGAAAVLRAASGSRAADARWLRALAALLATYGLLAGAIPPAGPVLLAGYMNHERFLDITGIPIQVLRALVAVALAAVVWLASHLPRPDLDKADTIWRYALGMLVAVVVVTSGGWALVEALDRSATNSVRLEAENQAGVVARLLEQDIERLEQAVRLMASADPMIRLVKDPGHGPTLERANRILDLYATSFRLEAAYILDTGGTALASSNRREPHSFVGRNYEFRGYFREALAGSVGHGFARGVTSDRIGHYHSAPVRDASGRVVGVAVLKAPVPALAKSAFHLADCLLVSPEGIVLDACDGSPAMRSLWPLSPPALAAIDSRHYGPGPFLPLLDHRPANGEIVSWMARRVLYVSAGLKASGWSIDLLAPLDAAAAQRLLGIGATMVLSLLIASFYVSLHRHGEYELRLSILTEQLARQARTDPLTGIGNRGWFQDAYEAEIVKARRQGRPLSIVMFDVDHFKAVNDTYGHHAGDRVLVTLTALARQELRGYDLICRWGGEEFVALFPETGGPRAGDIAERLRARIAAATTAGLPSITCSFGVTELRPDDSPDSLINRADAALYRAKDAGRNRVALG